MLKILVLYLLIGILLTLFNRKSFVAATEKFGFVISIIAFVVSIVILPVWFVQCFIGAVKESNKEQA